MMLVVRSRPGSGPVPEEVDVDTATTLVDAADRRATLLWLDVSDPTADELALVARTTGLSRERLRTLLDGRRPGLHDDARLVLVLPEAGGAGGLLHPHVAVLIPGPGWLVTIRPSGVDAGLEQLAEQLVARAPDATLEVGDAVIAVVESLIDAYWEVSDDLDDRLAGTERLSADDPDTAHDAVQSLRHDVLLLHRAAGPLRRVLAGLVHADIPGLRVDHRSGLRQLHDSVVELREQIDTQLLLLNGLSQTQILAASNRSNDVMRATSSWGAILVVATLITGVYGMNFQDMPELGWSAGYPFALTLIVGSTIVLYRIFRSRGWL